MSWPNIRRTRKAMESWPSRPRSTRAPARARFDWRGRPLQASYVNFYLPNDGVILPSFGDPNDEKARAVLADCFPGRDILQIDALDVVEGGGGIHCITQQEPAAP